MQVCGGKFDCASTGNVGTSSSSSACNWGGDPPTFCAATGRKITLTVGLAEETTYHVLSYMGKGTVHVAGIWRRGHAQPLWVMSSLAAERALTPHMEQMAALVLLASTIGFLVGEALRDMLCGGSATSGTPAPATESAEIRARRSGSAVPVSSSFSIARILCRTNGWTNSRTKSCSRLFNSSNRRPSEPASEAQPKRSEAPLMLCTCLRTAV